MSDADTPQGRRFSHVYLERGTPTNDSARMRRRLRTMIEENRAIRSMLVVAINRELGVRVYDTPQHFEQFCMEGDLRDLLDMVTLWIGVLRENGYNVSVPRVIGEVSRIFTEENVRYRVDQQGGVHFSIDAEFEANRAASIAGLNQARYVNVVGNFESAHRRLSEVPPDGKNAIRDVFSAAENLFRLMFPAEPRLTSQAVRNNLRAVTQRLYDENPPAIAAAAKQLDAFCDWIDACHNYRHEHGRDEVLEPPRAPPISAGWQRWTPSCSLVDQLRRR